jgi:hypothetical protein
MNSQKMFFAVGILFLCGVFGSVDYAKFYAARDKFNRDVRADQKKSAEELFTLATRYLYIPAFLNSATRKSLECDRSLSFRIHGKAQIHLADHPAKLWAHDDGELVYWNIEKYLWKFTTERDEVLCRPARLWDIKVGKTLKSWRAEERPEPNKLEDMKCERHITRKVKEPNARDVNLVTFGKSTWRDAPRVPVVAPMPIAYGEPSDETEKQFWERWNGMLTPTERKELRPLDDCIMAKQRVDLSDDLPAVPDRRTKVSNTKQPMTPKQEETFLALQKQMTVQETAKLCISLNVRPLDAARLTKQSYPAIRKAVVRLKAETRRNDVLILRSAGQQDDESQVA